MRLTWLNRRWLGLVRTPAHRLAMRLADRADALRDARRFRDAAILYEQALDLWPQRVGIQVQAGHMFKEAGDRAAAERHYLAAVARRPEDADLALQLGHFYKIGDRPVEAMAQYRRALALRPQWGEATRELAHLEQTGGGLREVAAQDAPAACPERDERIVRALLPGPPAASAQVGLDAIELRRLGAHRERSEWGLLPVLWGVEAVRGVCFSRQALRGVELRIGGAIVGTDTLHVGTSPQAGVTKFVFNLWVDVSAIAPGLHIVEVRLTGADRVTVRTSASVLVVPARSEAAHPGSDAVVEIDPADPRPLDIQIRTRPSILRRAGSAALPPPRSIAVLRTDQLGDIVISIPALRRLRALFPAARIVGLLTTANIDMARTLGLFDEVIAVPFPDDPEQRRRIMDPADQEALRARLAPYAFDVAIDLSISGISRPLLLLTGARVLYGFEDAWSWLSAGFSGNSHDIKTGQNCTPQSGAVLALVERLGTMVDSGAQIVRRDDLDPGRLAAFDLKPGRYVVLHTGARIAFSRWPGYPALARAIVERTGLDVVLLGEDAPPPAADTMDRRQVRVMPGRLAFDDLDALLSFCAGFVGNDSGPKHLAALRGVPVVSIHSARIHWGEWGQEISGAIISRRVPCAGCAIFHDADECGRDHACITDIGVAEVLDALLAELPA